MILEKYRKKRGYSQEELAELIDITPRQIQRIESGESSTSLKTLIKLIEILKMTDEDIIKIIKEISNEKKPINK